MEVHSTACLQAGAARDYALSQEFAKRQSHPCAGIRAARPADLGAVEQLCELLQADGIPPPDLISAFGSPDYRHYVVEREGQVCVHFTPPASLAIYRHLVSEREGQVPHNRR